MLKRDILEWLEDWAKDYDDIYEPGGGYDNKAKQAAAEIRMLREQVQELKKEEGRDAE